MRGYNFVAMVNIYLARHGQDRDNSNGILNGHRNEPLTDKGRQQAKDVGKKMVQAGFTLSTGSPSNDSMALSAVYSSPLQRAHETAEIFVNALDTNDEPTRSTPQIKVEVLNDLIERDFGIMTGQPTSSIVEKCGMDHILATETINYFLDPPGAETFPDLIDRANRLLDNIQKMAEGEDSTITTSSSILLVTHGDFGKMIYAAYYKLHWEDVLKQFHFGNSEVLLLSKDSPPEKAHLFQTLQFNA
mmetsp:Transcript_19230/g.40562  ORF Transcript_19230/g.40562 Transcript_19230/m.40562 type:complete len:245 (+) Transcript_19230:107-841(+)